MSTSIIFSPFDQFIISNHLIIEKKWNGFFSILNHTAYINDTILITSFFILLNLVLYFFLLHEKKSISKSIIRLIFIESYRFVFSIVKSYVYPKGIKYFPFFYYLFLFIVYSNLTGILPYSFTITSHLSITFTLAFIVWYGNMIVGFMNNGLRFFILIIPLGVPFILTPFITVVEAISYIFRPVSLALRLFANIVAGHILLDTLAAFLHKLILPGMFTIKSLFFSIIPFLATIVLILFECVVAILQAYIFIVLASIYLKDAYVAQAMH